ncbi:MAG: DEAD/DEAH box helicase [Ginsengibacter sp.]
MKKKSAKHKALRQRIPHTRRPEDMSAAQWQLALRKQIAEDEKFTIKKIGEGLVFTDYSVYNINSKNNYKVALRSADNSLNFCTCPDFKTNQLGTCKHIEAVLLHARAKPLLRRALKQSYKPPYSSVYLDYLGERKVKLRIGTEEHDAYAKLSAGYFDKDFVLNPEAFMRFENFLPKAHQLHSGFRCYDDAMEFIVQHRNHIQRKDLVQQQKNKLVNGISNAELFPYQQTGVSFVVSAGRCILADDMGLGKTLQAIVSTEVMRAAFKINKAIIVCPTSLKYQWKNEIEKFTGNKNVCVVEGNLLMRMKIYESNEYDYFIVSYQVAANDYDYLNNMQADMLILDEAQRIKNWRAKTSAKIKRIKTTYAIMLTGTPVENNIEELYSLMQIVNPYLLGSLHNFLSRYQVKEDFTDKVIGYKDLNEIGVLLKDVMLRRTKKQVLKDLPARMDKNLLVPMTEQQFQMHQEFGDIVAKLVHKWRKMGFLKEEDRQRLLNNLNLMRMVCDTTFIIDQETNYQTKLDELSNILDEIISMPGEKVVIFSQWERMTRLVAKMLTEKEIGFQNLHGSIPSKDRQALFTHFNNDADCRVFLSTDAGGVGLNLQAASYMVNLDIPWNPAVLEQRIGRIYRLGQKKNVSIINLVAQGTIEERMLDVLKFKRGVAAGILDGGDSNIFLGEDKFKQFMKSVESITGGLPEVTSHAVTGAEEIITEKELSVAAIGAIQKDLFEEEAIIEEKSPPAVIQQATSIEDEVLEKGTGFLQNLVQVLSNPESTQKLVSKLTETDALTGKTYLKIPLSNTNVVENALKLFSSLFSGMAK